MGQYKRHDGIDCFTPDNTETKVYIDYELTISDIIDICKKKFGDDVNIEDVVISSEYIHTECIYYDQYDPMDYTEYTVLTWYKE